MRTHMYLAGITLKEYICVYKTIYKNNNCIKTRNGENSSAYGKEEKKFQFYTEILTFFA